MTPMLSRDGLPVSRWSRHEASLDGVAAIFLELWYGSQRLYWYDVPVARGVL
jgi:hypothetical protein